eukprot:1893158-Alexandrium_andersonii.AAC.1
MDGQAQRPRFPWTRPLCLQRTHFGNVLLRWQLGDDVKFGLFLFALQRPYLVAFAVAHQLPSPGIAGCSGASSSDAAASPWAFRFELAVAKWFFSDEPF